MLGRDFKQNYRDVVPASSTAPGAVPRPGLILCCELHMPQVPTQHGTSIRLHTAYNDLHRLGLSNMCEHGVERTRQQQNQRPAQHVTSARVTCTQLQRAGRCIGCIAARGCIEYLAVQLL